MDPAQHDTNGCGEDCAQCGLSEHDVERADRAGLSGWRMVAAAGSCFLLPLVLAALGAVWAGPAGWAQALGAVVGLVFGGLMAVVVLRTIALSEENA